ncbi:ABC transporter ATP-binding protein [Clavibacter tessellarius]|uniref:ABC transporter ATP-binding protein n=1 Tax=Clavibacter tessellarius TaxID=31965 RepID=A0A225CN19_9MICO|nr:ABC transporter ATP-binding protein [Clavibacter michiganensis]MBT1637022.1 ABC transporter ATP-binding protein [Clavibacter michiganensis]OQJ63783.1 ABC transporter ATP-binding protein [Clavibacter michiganensis subsp. tessellarius]UKF33240.1 ABC transporter ATP-binding protein [Clavibacter michiganensis subsp. tessellarius]
MRLAIEDVSVRIGRATPVAHATLEARDGELVGLVGPNGSGKSTLLKALYRALPVAHGRVLVGDRDLRGMRPRDSARVVAALTQDPGDDGALDVREVVATGLTPHKGALDRDTAEDRELVDACLARTGATALADRSVRSLSGGERQRVMLAAALAQRPRILVLDEPTNHLDVATQLELLDLVRGLGVTVVVALHDLNLAAAYCDRIHVVQAGRIVAGGTPDEVLQPRLIRDVFGVDAHLGEHPVSGRRHLFFSSPQPTTIPDGRP